MDTNENIEKTPGRSARPGRPDGQAGLSWKDAFENMSGADLKRISRMSTTAKTNDSDISTLPNLIVVE